MTKKEQIIMEVADKLQDISNGLLMFSAIVPVGELYIQFQNVGIEIIKSINLLDDSLNEEITMDKPHKELIKLPEVNIKSIDFHFGDSLNNNE